MVFGGGPIDGRGSPGIRDTSARLVTDSTPAAAATLAALGSTGLVDWPVPAAVGDGAPAAKRLIPYRPTPRVQSGTTTAAAPARSSTQPKNAATVAPRPLPTPATDRTARPDPARVRSPKRKPRVERAVQYVRGSSWADQAFTNLTEAQLHVLKWCREIAGTRIHGATAVAAAPLDTGGARNRSSTSFRDGPRHSSKRSMP